MRIKIVVPNGIFMLAKVFDAETGQAIPGVEGFEIKAGIGVKDHKVEVTLHLIDVSLDIEADAAVDKKG